MSTEVRIRDAQPPDIEQIFGWILELADYEHAEHHVTGTPELLARALFGSPPCAEAVIAELRSADGEPAVAAGFALFYTSFSTWESRPGIWLEDLFVPSSHRRHGVGRALLSHVAGIALERGCARLEWAALDWNVPALDFYTTIGATRLDEWKLHRIDGPALASLADGPGPGR